MLQSNKKTFVLDTNVILHDPTCIDNFAEHDIIVPITVLEELDKFKKGNQTINFHAREFVRSLDKLSSGKLLNGGVAIGEGRGRISISLEKPVHDFLLEKFPAISAPDHKILNIACHVASDKAEQCVLVSKDVNLRIKAKAVGVKAEDYTTDQVKNFGSLYSGIRCVDELDSSLIENLYSSPEGVAANNIPIEAPLVANEYLILKNGCKSALSTFLAGDNRVVNIKKKEVYGIVPRNAEQSFAVHALCNDEVPLVTVSGKSGTGKTLLALASALEKRRNYRQILLARPIVPLSNKDIGYLPGDINSKIRPYMQPLYDNLSVIRGQFSEKSDMNQRLNRMLDEEKLVIEPLAYIRGRSLVKMYMIVDEAQNLTPHEVKTIVTRAGEGTKIVFTGDVNQIDHPYLDSRSNGLSYLIEKMQGQPLYAHITLQKGERSELSMLASDLL